jgi:soluble lytic murein transglycosylase-like protein
VILAALVVGAAVAGASATTGVSSVSSSPNAGRACDRRPDVEAARRDGGGERSNDSGDARRARRRHLDAAITAATDSHARGCAAAVAAAAAAVDGDKVRVLALLDDIITAYPVVAEDVRPRRALLLAEVGRVDDARRELARVDPRATAARARIELAIADATNDREQAQAILRRIAPRDASALGRLCDDGDADACRDLLIRHPRSAAALRLEQQREAPSPPSGTERTVAEHTVGFRPGPMAARLRALTGAARPHRAVREGRAWLAAQPQTADGGSAMVVRAALGEALLRTGDVAGAVDVTAGFATQSQTTEAPGVVAVDVDAARVHAKALSRLGRVDHAVAVWRSIVEAADRGTAQHAEQAAEAAFFGAFTLVEVDRVDEALAALSDARRHTSAAPTPTWETQRAWYEALLRLTAKDDPRGALAVLDVLVATKDREVRKFGYWRARALQRLDRTNEATAALRALVQDDPLDWYGQLARRDLGRPALAGAVVSPDALTLLARREAQDDDAATTQLLWNLGFDDEARARCRARAQRAVRRPSLVDVGVCHLVEDPTSGWRRGALFSPRITSDALPASPAWRVSYAAPWSSAVDEVATVASVPRSFVWAIMRTESGFDPTAVSIAGARGALQLLPSVARGVAEHHGLDGALTERLDDPRVAIALGGRLLGLLAREHGSLLLAAAAYNGAPENAASWAQRFGALPADVFVERIPFKEARDYVKRVLAVEAVYRGLDGGTTTLALPSSFTPAATPTLFPYRE